MLTEGLTPDHGSGLVPEELSALLAFVQTHQRLFVLTGAGCSTSSGIPAYRDARGAWTRSRPVQYQEFIHLAEVRRRYWARSLVGWRRFIQAEPNPTHHALAQLQRLGHVERLVTQNVDALHERAGTRDVVALHGRLDQVVCMRCGHRLGREDFQAQLAALNPRYAELAAEPLPDGDASLAGEDFEDFEDFGVPDCPQCGDIYKPDVVFFGESVPTDRVQAAYAALERAPAVLVIGSSLTVYSGFRFVQAAVRAGKPVAALNQGHTRGKELLDLKLESACETLLPALVQALETERYGTIS
jgi:NAD-dependent SIR2 family protein deacetylase